MIQLQWVKSVYKILTFTDKKVKNNTMSLPNVSVEIDKQSNAPRQNLLKWNIYTKDFNFPV